MEVKALLLPDMASGVSNIARPVCWDPLQTVGVHDEGAKRVRYILETMLCTKPSRWPPRSAVGFVFRWDALSSIQTLTDNTPTTIRYNKDLAEKRKCGDRSQSRRTLCDYQEEINNRRTLKMGDYSGLQAQGT